MINIQDLTPGQATHPGEMLADELDARNISQQDFARQIGMQKSQLNEIIKGKRSLNAETAILIEKTLDVPAKFWLNAQQNYDLDMAKIQKRVQERVAALEIWNLLSKYISVKYLKAQKFITGDPVEDIPSVKRMFNVSTVDELAVHFVTPLPVKFRKSERLEEDRINVFTWACTVHYRAKSQVVPKFQKHSCPHVISSLRQIITRNNNVLSLVTQTLNEQGIKFIYQEKADKAPIDGMSFWSDGNPAIGLTLRHNRLDNLAFTLFHELGHVYMHLPANNKACFIDLDLDDPLKDQEENEANKFAQENLLANEDWKHLEESAEIFNPLYITRFAEQVGIHPAVIAGQVCYRTGNYKWSRKGEIDNVVR